MEDCEIVSKIGLLHQTRNILEARNMNDMSSVIIPRSDQWNFDDFLAGPLSFKITSVDVRQSGEQPVEISMEGTKKYFRPCKSMCRVLVAAWGPDANKYKGRSITLYGDPDVKWGGMSVGGIRISHLSDIENPITMALTATKGSRKPYTVKPMVTSAPASPMPQAEVDEWMDVIKNAATIEDLKTGYSNAYKAARKLKDEKRMAAFLAAYDERKATFELAPRSEI